MVLDILFSFLDIEWKGKVSACTFPEALGSKYEEKDGM
jgi:hypothetical protein